MASGCASGACTDGSAPQSPGAAELLTVADHRVECTGLSLQLCYRVHRDTGAGGDGADWELLYDPIRGFTYEWGVESVLRVRVEPVADPPADAASGDLVLVEVLSQRRAPPEQRFTLELTPFAPDDGRPLIVDQGSGTFRFHGDGRFACASDAVCDELRRLLEASTPRIQLELSHAGAPGAPMQVRAARAAPSA